MAPIKDGEAALMACAEHTLAVLRSCRENAPAEWDALVATPVGSWLTSAWDDLKAAILKAEGK